MLPVALLAFLSSTTESASAPGDQYFGKLKMSAIRIRYEFMQLRPRYEKHELLPEQAEHLADLAEDAFYAWAKAYPKDPWLASTGYLMAGIYAELPGAPAHKAAVQAFSYVKTAFPTSSYAKKSVAALHTGPPLRQDPQWAIEMRAVTPSPSASPEASPSASASPAPSAAPSVSPTSSPP